MSVESDDRVWGDQPLAVVGQDRLFHGTIGEVTCDIRRVIGEQESYYLTVGNLFQSYTVKAGSHVALWRLLATLGARRKLKAGQLPYGCEVVLAAAGLVE